MSRAASLSTIFRVLVSISTQSDADEAAISSATERSASGLGREQTMTCAFSATAAAEASVSTPVARAASTASAERSNPWTVKPAFTR